MSGGDKEEEPRTEPAFLLSPFLFLAEKKFFRLRRPPPLSHIILSFPASNEEPKEPSSFSSSRSQRPKLLQGKEGRRAAILSFLFSGKLVGGGHRRQISLSRGAQDFARLAHFCFLAKKKDATVSLSLS